jgi:hypothetical protein
MAGPAFCTMGEGELFEPMHRAVCFILGISKVPVSVHKTFDFSHLCYFSGAG